MAVTEDGSAWAWGEGDAGQLGLADMLPHTEPIKVNLDARVVMVSCGFGYTLVATIAGELFSWGYGSYGQLGHGDRKHRGTLTCVAGMHGIPVATVAAGELHATAVTAQGDVWTWGCGENGRLGHQDEDDRLAPQRLGPFLSFSDYFCPPRVLCSIPETCRCLCASIEMMRMLTLIISCGFLFRTKIV